MRPVSLAQHESRARRLAEEASVDLRGRLSGATALHRSERPCYVGPPSLFRIAQFTQALKKRLETLLRLGPGQRVLDIGCGPGIDTISLSALVAPDGMAVGVDFDAQMIATARKRARAAATGHLACHVQADAARLPYTTDFFDACRCERVLQHVRNGHAVVAEMARVTRPGGVVVAADTDWASLSIAAADVETERRIVTSIPDLLHNGYAGRELPRLLADCGLEQTVVEVFPVHWATYDAFRTTSFMTAGLHDRLIANGRVGPQEWSRFVRDLEVSDSRGVFFASAAIIIAAGMKSSQPRCRPSPMSGVRSIGGHS